MSPSGASCPSKIRLPVATSVRLLRKPSSSAIALRSAITSRRPLGPDALAKLEGIAAPDIRLALVDGDLWVDFSRKPSETKLLSQLTTKKLGIGTLRNANTINGLAAMLA
jgi:uncharacterized protein (DUF1697 family)